MLLVCFMVMGMYCSVGTLTCFVCTIVTTKVFLEHWSKFEQRIMCGFWTNVSANQYSTVFLYIGNFYYIKLHLIYLADPLVQTKQHAFNTEDIT